MDFLTGENASGLIAGNKAQIAAVRHVIPAEAKQRARIHEHKAPKKRRANAALVRSTVARSSIPALRPE